MNRLLRAPVVAGLLLLAAGAAEAAWDFGGLASFRQSWSENATYSSDPNTHVVAITSLGLTGRAAWQGQRTRFDAAYSPRQEIFQNDSDLNRLSHLARVNFAAELGARTTLSLSEAYALTPEAGISSESFTTPVLFTQYDNRRSSTASAGLKFRVTPRADLRLDARHHVQSYSDPFQIDWEGVSASVEAANRLSPRFTFEYGGGYAWNEFDRPAATAIAGSGREFVTDRETLRNDVANAHIGGQIAAGTQGSVGVRAGWNRVEPQDPNRPSSSGAQAQLSYTRRGRHVRFNGGYQRDFSAGSGTFTVSRNDTVYMGLGADFTTTLSGDVILNGTRSRDILDASKLQSGATGSDRDVKTVTGTATLNWKLSRSLSAQAIYARHEQRTDLAGAVDLAFNRYAVGLTAAFD